MNTASLENCKKLFELSGWVDSVYHPVNGDKQVTYSLGYLLRKLPSMLEDEDDKGAYYTLHLGKEGEKDYYANYWHFDNPLVGIDILEPSSTPEDATALLAIKLFEEAVL